VKTHALAAGVQRAHGNRLARAQEGRVEFHGGGGDGDVDPR